MRHQKNQIPFLKIYDINNTVIYNHTVLKSLSTQGESAYFVCVCVFESEQNIDNKQIKQ